jgi:hypothetical protein
MPEVQVFHIVKQHEMNVLRIAKQFCEKLNGEIPDEKERNDHSHRQSDRRNKA